MRKFLTLALALTLTACTTNGPASPGAVNPPAPPVVVVSVVPVQVPRDRCPLHGDQQPLAEPVVEYREIGSTLCAEIGQHSAVVRTRAGVREARVWWRSSGTDNWWIGDNVYPGWPQPIAYGAVDDLELREGWESPRTP